MAQESKAGVASQGTGEDEHSSGKSLLGPILCWAVVFADIGTSIYYVPSILYNTEGITTLAGFFVLLTMSVFVLLTLKYAEVSHRFPQGGGVVTVAAQAMNHWVGALGGMFILVDYFLTAAISCLSGVFYLGVVLPAISPFALWIAVATLILLGILNWVGISESAKVSFVFAIIAFLSDVAILVTVFTHISFTEFLSLIPTTLYLDRFRSFLPCFLRSGEYLATFPRYENTTEKGCRTRTFVCRVDDRHYKPSLDHAIDNAAIPPDPKRSNTFGTGYFVTRR
jgi:amino acid transporter